MASCVFLCVCVGARVCVHVPKWSHVLGRKFPPRHLRTRVRLWRFRALDEPFAALTFHEPLNFYDSPVFVFFLMMWVFFSGWLTWRLSVIKTSHVVNQNYPRGASKGQKNTLIHLKDEKKKTRAAALWFSFFPFFFPRAIDGLSWPAVFDTKGDVSHVQWWRRWWWTGHWR